MVNLSTSGICIFIFIVNSAHASILTITVYYHLSIHCIPELWA